MLFAILVIVIIREIVNTVFYTVPDISIIILDISVVIIKQFNCQTPGRREEIFPTRSA